MSAAVERGIRFDGGGFPEAERFFAGLRMGVVALDGARFDLSYDSRRVKSGATSTVSIPIGLRENGDKVILTADIIGSLDDPFNGVLSPAFNLHTIPSHGSSRSLYTKGSFGDEEISVTTKLDGQTASAIWPTPSFDTIHLNLSTPAE